MNGKEFTEYDININKTLSTISTRLDYVRISQEAIIKRLDTSSDKNDIEHKEICLKKEIEHDKINEKITSNKVKIHWIIGIGVGVISVAGLSAYLSRIYG